MRLLDIIVPHYKEPWELVEHFFKMMDLQRGIDFSEIRILMIHDGTEAFPDEYFEKRPYRVDQLCVPHRGLNAIRNTGILKADAEWISFSDCDDMYYNVCGVRSVLEAMHNADGVDFLSANIIMETMPNGGLSQYVKMDSTDIVCAHGKYYRLKTLRDLGLRFEPDMPYNEDGLFNSILCSYIPPERIGLIDTPFPVYIWTARDGSMTHSKGGAWWRMLYSMYLRDRRMADAYEKRRTWSEFVGASVRAIVDAYYLLQHEDVEKQERYEELVADIQEFFVSHKRLLQNIAPDEMKNIMDTCYEVVCTDRYKYDDPDNPTEVRLKDEYPEFADWVCEMDKKWIGERKHSA